MMLDLKPMKYANMAANKQEAILTSDVLKQRIKPSWKVSFVQQSF